MRYNSSSLLSSSSSLVLFACSELVCEMKHIITIFTIAVVLSAVANTLRESEVYAPFPNLNEMSCKPKEKFRPAPWCHDCVCDATGKSVKCSSACFTRLIQMLREKLRDLTLPYEIALNSAKYGPRPGDDNFSCKPSAWLQPRPWCHSCFCNINGKMAVCPRVICSASPPEWYILQEAFKNTTLQAEITRIFQIVTILKGGEYNQLNFT